ncbi:MAG: restriction endonuclease subunit S, partial [Gemmobacter sp.]
SHSGLKDQRNPSAPSLHLSSRMPPAFYPSGPVKAIFRGALKSDLFQDHLSGASRSAQAGFNKGDLRDIDFPLPPLAEQHRIVAKVDALMALCDRLAATLTTTDTTRARLLEALLHEALTPTAESVTEAAE